MSAETNIEKLKAKIAEAQVYAKFIAAMIGGVLIIAAQFIPSEWVPMITGILASITAFSVWRFPNKEVSE